MRAHLKKSKQLQSNFTEAYIIYARTADGLLYKAVSFIEMLFIINLGKTPA